MRSYYIKPCVNPFEREEDTEQKKRAAYRLEKSVGSTKKRKRVVREKKPQQK